MWMISSARRLMTCVTRGDNFNHTIRQIQLPSEPFSIISLNNSVQRSVILVFEMATSYGHCVYGKMPITKAQPCSSWKAHFEGHWQQISRCLSVWSDGFTSWTAHNRF